MTKSTHTGEYDALRGELRAARDAAGFSQRELAGKLRVPHSWVAKVENGERRIDLIEFLWLLSACGADPIPVVERLLARTRKRAKGGSSK